MSKEKKLVFEGQLEAILNHRSTRAGLARGGKNFSDWGQTRKKEAKTRANTNQRKKGEKRLD